MQNVLMSMVTLLISIVIDIYGFGMILSAKQNHEFWPMVPGAILIMSYGSMIALLIILAWHKPKPIQIIAAKNLSYGIVAINFVASLDSFAISGHEMLAILITALLSLVAFLTVRRLALRKITS